MHADHGRWLFFWHTIYFRFWFVSFIFSAWPLLITAEMKHTLDLNLIHGMVAILLSLDFISKFYNFNSLCNTHYTLELLKHMDFGFDCNFAHASDPFSINGIQISYLEFRKTKRFKKSEYRILYFRERVGCYYH